MTGITCRSIGGKPDGGLFGTTDEHPHGQGRNHQDTAEQCVGNEFQHGDRLQYEGG
ncbi:MAG: hypothetical protein LZF60_80515 [Nitrospira sp.]|nr:MAG: hypothetical protein LZF60_80515 [Nitrospira sp.]